jgi:hypothetical protein
MPELRVNRKTGYGEELLKNSAPEMRSSALGIQSIGVNLESSPLGFNLME